VYKVLHDSGILNFNVVLYEMSFILKRKLKIKLIETSMNKHI
jgi:hypothetical protein